MNHDAPDNVSTIHLIGICGTGMGALAGILQASGYRVSGSDQNVYPPMSTQLEKLNIPILKGYRPEHVAHRPDLVIIGNVIRKDNPEARAAIDSGLACLSFPGALRRFYLSKKRTIALCGTHGKTTTTALVAHLLQSAGRDPSFLVGGVMENIGSGFHVGQGGDFVIEGDEYDTAFFDKVPKFIRYEPDWAVAANIEFDHADIYADLEQIRKVFAQLIAQLPKEGICFAGIDCPQVRGLIEKASCNLVSFGLDPSARYHPGTWRIHDRRMEFTVLEGDRTLGPFLCTLTGAHNLKNLLAAVAVCREAGLSEDEIRLGLESFRGVKRRQEVRGVQAGVTVIDDFAHHPTAVFETLNSLKETYRANRLIAVFEPRTNTSRRNFFQKRYAEAFESADRVWIAPVFGLDEIEESLRFDPQRLAEDLCTRGKQARYAKSLDQLLEDLVENARPGDLVVLMSNGGFGGLHERLLARLKEGA